MVTMPSLIACVRIRSWSAVWAVIFFNAAHYLVAEDPALRNVLVGRTLRFPLPPTARQVVLEPPAESGGRTEEPIDDPSVDYVLSQTAFPGFYRVTVRGGRLEVSQDELSRGLLAAVAVLLLLELVLAGSFGTRRRAAA